MRRMKGRKREIEVEEEGLRAQSEIFVDRTEHGRTREKVPRWKGTGNRKLRDCIIHAGKVGDKAGSWRKYLHFHE